MGDDARPILVVGSVALDAVHTPTESASEVLGGAASYFCLSASMFAPVRLVAVVGEDFPAAHRRLLESRPVDLTGLQVRPGKTFRWTARYSGVRLEDRETLDTQLNVFKDFHPVLPDAYRDSKVVFLANSPTARMVPVKRGISDEEYVEIVEGLQEGQTVISGGYKAINRELEDGKKVVVDNSKGDKKESKP